MTRIGLSSSLKSLAALVALAVYLAGGVSFETVHGFRHYIDSSERAEIASDPCLETIYHLDKSLCCHHQKHFSSLIRSCKLCQAFPTRSLEAKLPVRTLIFHFDRAVFSTVTARCLFELKRTKVSRAPPFRG